MEETQPSEFRSCVKREVGLGSHSLSHLSPSPIIHTVSVDVKHRERQEERSWKTCRVQELCEQGGGPGLSFPIPLFPRP